MCWTKSAIGLIQQLSVFGNTERRGMKLKWQKPELKELGGSTKGCIGCEGGYSAFDDACSKGYQAEVSCTQGAGHMGHVSPS